MRLTHFVHGSTQPAAQPFLKWAGGKWAIAPQIAALLPKDLRARRYREPFLGGGAMFFYLKPKHAVLSDTVGDLVTTYSVVKTSVDALITRLEALRSTHDEEQYYAIRERYNCERSASALDRASWLIYLNKTGYNGLFRTNSRGHFNVPVGRYANPGIVDEANMRLASSSLANAELRHAPFEHLLDVAEKGDFIYLDPPYVPLSKSSSFAAYAEGGFGPEDQRRLAEVFRELDRRGCLLALSNSDTPLVRELYADFDLATIVAPRRISAKAATRAPAKEILVRNVRRYPADRSPARRSTSG